MTLKLENKQKYTYSFLLRSPYKIVKYPNPRFENIPQKINSIRNEWKSVDSKHVSRN